MFRGPRKAFFIRHLYKNWEQEYGPQEGCTSLGMSDAIILPSSPGVLWLHIILIRASSSATADDDDCWSSCFVSCMTRKRIFFVVLDRENVPIVNLSLVDNKDELFFFFFTCCCGCSTVL